METRIVRVFIASPGDVKEERALAEHAIRAVSDKIAPLFNMVLQPVSWELFRPSASSENDRTIQEPITRQLQKSRLFIGILFRRYGETRTKKRGISGTHEEFKYALDHRKDIEILTYFRYPPTQVANTTDDIKQADKLHALKREIRMKGVRYSEYQSPEDFGRHIEMDLMQAFLEIVTEVRRREKLSSFFRFGIPPTRHEPSVLIAYPPVHEHFGPSIRGDFNWKERLLPNVVYEDFKAIQKVESALRCLGISDYGAITVPDQRLTGPGNIIWLCLPRNPYAQERLSELGDRVRFSFQHDECTQRRYLTWKHSDGATLRVDSPLAKYLDRQRPKESTWHASFGYCVAKDYAVLSRFKDETQSRGSPFYQYFIAGIRGLGTWGVGWYIDRCHDDIAKIADSHPDEDIQILLEVTFKNHRINRVVDVSDCRQEYFNDANSDVVIEQDISKYKLSWGMMKPSKSLQTAFGPGIPQSAEAAPGPSAG